MEAKKQLTYILSVTFIIISIVLVVLFVKSNHIINNLTAQATNPDKLLILTTDEITDQSWGSLAYKGKLLIEEQYDVVVDIHAEVGLDNQTEKIIHNSVQDDTAIIIGHGREFSDFFHSISPQYPETEFVTVHGDNTNSNLAIYTFDQQEIEFVAGVAAALKTSTKKVGVIDAIDNLDKDWGFSTGLEEIDSEIQLVYDVVYSRDNKTKAVEIANDMVEKEVDIIFTKGNSYNKAVINFAKKHDIYLIGYLEDQSYMAKELMLTSVLNNVPNAYLAIMKDYYSEGGITSEKHYLDTTDGVYELAPLGPMFTEQEKKIIQQKKDDILAKH
ncbi:BMP family ABC transporter substrate-binding protein [Gracilibacillus sp. YIM 98692]|uniref:BMP family ABC transporter substrate-binding protein n=1 Tax=Gracilibacillus sp. YIM 98692 TaxID=2663532 RepID=UPI0013D4E8FA|nr:BMP family ABC transporter substrate-binding protein [Gracilibacillus sp. YIM 98692]